MHLNEQYGLHHWMSLQAVLWHLAHQLRAALRPSTPTFCQCLPVLNCCVQGPGRSSEKNVGGWRHCTDYSQYLGEYRDQMMHPILIQPNLVKDLTCVLKRRPLALSQVKSLTLIDVRLLWLASTTRDIYSVLQGDGRSSTLSPSSPQLTIAGSLEM